MKDPNASLKASSINKYAKYKRWHTQIRSLRETKEHKVNRLTKIRYSKTLSKTDITKIKQEVTTRKDKISVNSKKLMLLSHRHRVQCPLLFLTIEF